MEQVKGEADLICNAGFYDMATYAPVGHLKVQGKVYSAENWNCWGYVWDKGDDLRMAVVPDTEAENHLSGVELLSLGCSINAKPNYLAEVGGARPRTAMALTGKGELLLFCTDEGMTPEQLRQVLYEAGAVTALMLDSGGSSQCDFGGEGRVTSSRRVHNYLAVYEKKNDQKEGEGTMAKKVCLDPGHGGETAGKCSPDGSFYEHEFNLDMALRYKRILERHGVETVLTRSGTAEVTLTDRVKIANESGADLFVSLHSNANGDGTVWTKPSGYSIYTSAAGEAAGRNKVARAVLKRVKEAGIPLLGDGLFHDISLYVLRETKAPAVLIEHGFHTNREETERLRNEEYREKLAECGCKGMLDYLGIAWKAEVVPNEMQAVCPHCGGGLKIVKG